MPAASSSIRRSTAASRLRERLGERVGRSRSVELRTHPLVLELTGKTDAAAPGWRASSASIHAAATALLRGDGSPTAFTDEAVQRPGDHGAARQGRGDEPTQACHEDAVHIAVTLDDGSAIELHVEHAIGSLERPLSRRGDRPTKFANQSVPVHRRGSDRGADRQAWALEARRTSRRFPAPRARGPARQSRKDVTRYGTAISTLGILNGDDIGHEIVPAAVEVVTRRGGAEPAWRSTGGRCRIGRTALDTHGSTFPEGTMEALRQMDGFILGPIGHQAYPKVPGAINPHPILRKHFNLFANVRPTRSYPGLGAIYDDVDLVIVRENNEGFQPDRNVVAGSGEFRPTEDVTISVRVITRGGLVAGRPCRPRDRAASARSG